MRLLLVSLLTAAAGLPAFANNVDFNVVPNSPIVITGDYINKHAARILGPSFEAEFEIANRGNEAITVASITVDVTAQATGLTQTHSFAMVPITVQPGQNATSPTFFAQQLPHNNGSYTYKVKTSASGWVGAKKNPTSRLDLDLEFFTR